MTNVLIGITSCHKFLDRVAAQRKTWIPNIPEYVDYRVFLGQPPEDFVRFYGMSDEVILNVPDDYESLHLKSREMIRYAYDNGYEYLFKIDDDCYLLPDRLLTSGFESHDYVGAWIIGEGDSPASAIRYQNQKFVPGGCGVWLSRKAMKILLDSDVTKLSETERNLEDHWVGWTLDRAGIKPRCDSRYLNLSCFAHPENFENLPEYTGDPVFPSVNGVISICEFEPEEMIIEHNLWLSGKKTLPVLVKKPAKTEFNTQTFVFKNPA